MFCMSCGTKLPSDAAFCPKCGAKVGGSPTSVDNQTTAPVPETDGEMLANNNSESECESSEEVVGQETAESEEEGADAFDNEEDSAEQSDSAEEPEAAECEQEDDGNDGSGSFWGSKAWLKTVKHLGFWLLVGVLCGIGRDVIKGLWGSDDKQTRINDDKQARLEEARKSMISVFASAASGSVKSREVLIDFFTTKETETRKNATDDGETDGALVRMCVEGMVDDKITAYKEKYKEYGNDKLISLGDLQVPKPPLVVSLGVGFLSTYVVTVRNESAKTQYVNVSIYKGDDWDSTGAWQPIEPGGTAKFGYLEFEKSWRPKPGDKGIVRIRGFNQLLFFELLPEIRWFESTGYIVSPVCPLGLKRDLLSRGQ